MSNRKRPRILLLEDDHEMRAILTQILAYSDYEVVAVETGHEAIAQAREQTFDLIVADVRVEGPDGIQVIEEAQQRQSGIGSLVVSGYASLEETDRAQAIGVGAFLKKPFETARFLELVRQQLQKKENLKEMSSAGNESGAALTAVLQTLVGCLEDERLRPPPALVQRVRELATRAATAVGLEPGVLQQVTLAAVLASLPEELAGETRQRLVAAPLLLPSLSEALAHQQPREGPPPLEARLLKAVVAAARFQISGQGQGLDEPGLDPALVQILREQPQTPPGPSALSEQPPQVGQGLLAIGQALERAGDRQGARASYLEYLQLQPDVEGQVEARLGLARLAEGDEQALEQVKLATSSAEKVGHYRACLAQFSGGILLRRRGAPEALELLRRAVPSLLRFGFADAVSLSAVALMAAGENIEAQRWQPLCRRLLAPSLGRQLEEQADWLVPDLLDNLCRSAVPGFLTQFCNLFPLLVARLLRERRLSPQQYRFLAETLRQENQQIPEPVWRQLRASEDAAVREAAEQLIVRAEGLSNPSMVRVSSFGPFEVACGGETFPDRAWRTQKTKYLFAYLAYDWGRPCHDEVLLEAVFADEDASKKGLYWSTSVIRNLFKQAGFRHDIIPRQLESLSANAEVPAWHDVGELQKHLRQARQYSETGAPEQACREWQSAIEFYRGPYLEGCYHDWAIQRRDSWEREVLGAAMSLAETQLGLAEHREAVAAARRALVLDPAHQEAHLMVMRALIEGGRPEAAVEQFHECEKAMKSHYGAEPNTTIIEYYHRARMALPDSGGGLIG